MIRIGLTGSIGMGKSTVAAMFARAGVPVFDADAVVRQLQGPAGRLLPAIEARFPGTTGPAGVDRAGLGAQVLAHPVQLRALEAIVHPVVAAERRRFLQRHRSRPMVVLDIPLLFETGGSRAVDLIVVVSAPAWVQRRRVLARPGMSAARLQQILRQQMPDAQKRRRADVIIETARTPAQTRRAVMRVISCVRAGAGRY